MYVVLCRDEGLILFSMFEMLCCGFYDANESLTTQIEVIIVCGLFC